MFIFFLELNACEHIIFVFPRTKMSHFSGFNKEHNSWIYFYIRLFGFILDMSEKVGTNLRYSRQRKIFGEKIGHAVCFLFVQ